jgi:hypothetical protein
MMRSDGLTCRALYSKKPAMMPRLHAGNAALFERRVSFPDRRLHILLTGVNAAAPLLSVIRVANRLFIRYLRDWIV